MAQEKNMEIQGRSRIHQLPTRVEILVARSTAEQLPLHNSLTVDELRYNNKSNRAALYKLTQGCSETNSRLSCGKLNRQTIKSYLEKMLLPGPRSIPANSMKLW